MTNNDREEFARVWAAAWTMYGKEATAQVIAMVFNALASYSIEDVRRGLSAHMSNPDSGQYAPKPADVIKHISGNSQSASGEAWAKVDRAIRCVGPWRSVVFDDPKIHAAIERLGGWQRVANTEGGEYPFLEHKFKALYQGFTVQLPETYPRKLIGVSEQENGHKGAFERGRVSDETVLIGDADKAKHVYSGGGDMGVVAIRSQGAGHLLESVAEDVKRIGGAA